MNVSSPGLLVCVLFYESMLNLLQLFGEEKKYMKSFLTDLIYLVCFKKKRFFVFITGRYVNVLMAP